VDGGSTTVEYTGDADVNNATFNWTFNGGNANPATGPGPITVDWPVAGPRTITLTVIENGCTSETVSQTVEVEAPLDAPMIQCGTATTTSVEFTWADVAGAIGYSVNVISGQTGMLNGTTYTVDNLMPEEVVTIEVTAEGDGACGNSSAQFTCEALPCPNFVVDITVPQNDICLDGMAAPFDLSATVNGGTGNGVAVWSGTGITDMDAGTFDPSVAMEGAHVITFTYTEGPCDVIETVTINVFDVPTADFSVNPNLECINEEITVEYTGDADVNNASFAWNFSGGNASATTGPGPITVSWPTGGMPTITLTVTENGCTASSSQDVTIEEPLAAPVINCNSTPSSITFTWDDVPGASSYTVNVLQGASGTQNGNSYEVTGLNPGDIVEIQVEAVGTGPCGSSFASLECVAEDCPDVMIDLPVVDPICLDASATTVDLDATLMGDDGTGTETWSGPGITDGVAGIFDPTVAMVGNHVISYTYQQGNCTYNSSLTIIVNPQPTADFTVESPICVDGTSTITFTGSAGAMATYDWNFGDGTVVSGMDAGPYEISFPTSGTKTITLTVTDNNCASEEFTQTIEVDEPLPAPVISCNSTNTSITFSWDDIAGANGFDVIQIFGQAGTLNGNSYEVTGLEPGDSVRIRVIALDDGPCDNVASELTCYAQDCPDITVTIDPVGPICSNEGVQTLTASASAGMGTFTWSGTGITDADAGTFDPSIVIDGTVTISVVYTEGVCTYTETIDITVNKQPTADFTAVSPVCIDENSNIVYTGTGGPTATYDWNFDGGTIVSGMGSGPYNISWPDGGTKTITLTVTEDGCPSEEFTQTVEVEEPLPTPMISCDSDNTSITFSWDDIAGAQGFDIELVFGQAGVINGNSYEVTGLEPGDSVRIRVIALNDGPCGNTESSITCYAQDCPDITVTIDPFTDLCQDAGLQTLTATASAGMGTFTWSGLGIIDADAGIFDPTVFDGTEPITVTYTDGVCSYSTSLDITVFELPAATFEVEDFTVCVGQVTEIDYSGSASSNAVFNWNFDVGGNATPGGTEIGPHDIEWTSPGIKIITLTVEENGCESPDEFMVTVDVQQPLDMPVISCDSDNTSITFSWDDVDGAEGYEVNVLSGQVGTINGNTFTITDMTPGESATIEVVALDSGPCGNVSSEITCIAADCPDRVVEIADPGALCADDDPITLTATIDGMAGTGTYVFTGPGVIDGMAGTFNPALVAGNTVTVTATYTEDVCTYTGSIEITVNSVPIAAFTATSPICVDATSTVEFTGVASMDATYVWDFDGGMGGTGAGPFDVSWTDAGTKTITLTVIDNGCESETITQTVEVDPLLADPIINCNTTNTSIEFVWNDVAGATGYDVVVTSGQTGTLDGTTFTVDNLTPGEEVTITVTAIGDGACGNSSAMATCVAQDCPGFVAAMTVTESICLGISDNPTITFTFDTSSDGPFMVDYLNETTGVQNSITVTNGETITLTDITETSTIVFVSYSDVTLADCVYPGNQTEVITVSTPVNAGTADQPSQLCVGTAETINLADLVINGDLGGQWSETSGTPSTGGAFNAATGTLNTGNLAAGTYTFEYLLDAAAPCEDQSVVVEVIVNDEPVADAGENMTLTCNMGMLNIGGSNTSSGTGITYQWTADDPTIIIANPDIAFPEVSQPGTYTLTVTNEFGCTTTDVVEVSANFDVPVAEVAISDISCFEANDGAITISNVTGGAGGYQYSLNGGPFTTTPQFGNLGADDYSLVIQDANGCFSELMVSLTQPEEVVVTLSTNLGPDNIITLGDSVRLEAIFDPSLNIDTLIWQPDSIAKGNSPVVFVNPTTATNYSVTIIDENGCSDTDDMMVLVRIERPVYVPNVFSPNEDGFNDIFYIQGSDFIKQIRTFQVYNRWGESVLELTNFQPNDPSFGWDGTYRGKPVNPAVYVWFAEIEFEDGEVILYKGDVAVMK
jgi:gliding motility-associated-like protein